MTIRITRYGGQVRVWSPFPKGDLIERFKSVGGRWNKKCWVMPDSGDAAFVQIVEFVRAEYNCALSQSPNGNWHSIPAVKPNTPSDEWPAFAYNQIRPWVSARHVTAKPSFLKRMFSWLK